MNKQTADRPPRVLQSRLINRPFSSISCLTGPNLRSTLRVGELSASSAGTDEEEWLPAGKGRTEWVRSREKKPHPRYDCPGGLDRGMSVIRRRLIRRWILSGKPILLLLPLCI
jgi:hypothetical protein